MPNILNSCAIRWPNLGAISSTQLMFIASTQPNTLRAIKTNNFLYFFFLCPFNFNSLYKREDIPVIYQSGPRKNRRTLTVNFVFYVVAGCGVYVTNKHLRRVILLNQREAKSRYHVLSAYGIYT